MCPSKSDSQLAEKADDFISLLQKLKLPTSKSNYCVEDAPTADSSNPLNPFWQYKQRILDSKSRIILL